MEIEFLIDDVMRRGFVYSLTASTGAGKTGIAVPMAIDVAAGAVYGEHQCNPGSVIYVAAENAEDVRARFVVAVERLRLPEDVLDRVHVLPRTFALQERLAELCDLVEQLNAALVIIDTDQAVSLNGDAEENDNTDRLKHAQRLREITQSSCRPAVLDLCHPRKSVNGRDDLVPRGGGAFLNEIDGNFRLWRDGDQVELTSDPAKFRGAPVSMSFRIELVTTGRVTDTKGRRIPVPYFEPISDVEASAIAREAWCDENRVVWAMDRDPKGTQADWARGCGWLAPDGAPRKDKVNRLLKRLENWVPALVKKDRNGRWYLTDAGKKEATKP